MSNLLEQLYCGEICPVEHPVTGSPEYPKLKEKYSSALDRFYEALSPRGLELYLEMESAQNAVRALEYQETFAHGFQLGAALLLEIYNGRWSYLSDRDAPA